MREFSGGDLVCPGLGKQLFSLILVYFLHYFLFEGGANLSIELSAEIGSLKLDWPIARVESAHPLSSSSLVPSVTFAEAGPSMTLPSAPPSPRKYIADFSTISAGSELQLCSTSKTILSSLSPPLFQPLSSPGQGRRSFEFMFVTYFSFCTGTSVCRRPRQKLNPAWPNTSLRECPAALALVTPLTSCTRCAAPCTSSSTREGKVPIRLGRSTSPLTIGVASCIQLSAIPECGTTRRSSPTTAFSAGFKTVSYTPMSNSISKKCVQMAKFAPKDTRAHGSWSIMATSTGLLLSHPSSPPPRTMNSAGPSGLNHSGKMLSAPLGFLKDGNICPVYL